jgi:class 3 adenylate cyclase/tetratricopeptide (TPR) repeat protein
VNVPGSTRPIDDLLDRAIDAINSGDHATASALAERVLAADSGNRDAEDLLAAPAAGSGELRRLTILFADVVDSTALSTHTEPEVYFRVIGRYRQQVNEIVDRYQGHVFSTKGDGLLAVFGHPIALEDGARRAVQAGLDITREVAVLSEQVRSRFGFDISVRAGVHRGLVYLDLVQDDVYGLGANLAARVCGLAPPGSVVVSGAIAPLVRDFFELAVRPAQRVKGVDEPVDHYEVIGERVSPGRIPLGPLIGRDGELRHLRDSWVAAGRGTLSTPGVAFVGEAGVGKSRLATVAADLAAQAGDPVLALLGSPFHVSAGLRPVRVLLEQRCGIERTADQAQRLRLLQDEVRARGLDVGCTVPLLAPVLGIAPGSGYQPVQVEGTKLAEQIGEAILRYLLACAGDGPAVVLAEDVQWFDPSTIDVVESLLRAGTGKVLVVLTARDIGSLPNLAGVDVFTLAPLTAEETDELITALDPSLSAEERADVGRRCDGVPLYIEEVVVKSREQPTDAARWVRVPDALYEPLFARLRTSDATIQVVQAAAMIGRTFDKDILRNVLSMSEADFEEAIDDLEAALVFEPTAADAWRFRHELLREVASELPPPSVRPTLHGQVADALVTHSKKPDWPLVADHYAYAERFDEAIRAYQQAALDARHRGALEEARGFLARAVVQSEQMAPGSDRDRREIRLRLQRGFLGSAVEGPSSRQAAADFERCLQLCEADLRDEDLFPTLLALWAYYLPRGDLRRAQQLTDSVSVKVSSGQNWIRAANQASFGMIDWFRGNFAEARVVLEKAAAAFADADRTDYETVWFVPTDPIASTHTHLALTRVTQGDISGAEREFAETVNRVAGLGFPQGPFTLAYNRSFEVWMHTEASRLDRAAAIAEQLTTEAEQHGFDFWVVVGATQQATISALSALAAGDPDADELQGHIELLTVLVETWREAESLLFISFYDAVVAKLLTAAGRHHDARERLNFAMDLSASTEVNFYRAELLRLRAQTADDVLDRDADLRAAIDTACEQRAPIFELRAAITDFELHGATSRATLVEAVGHFPAESSWPELTRGRALLE